MRKDVVWSAMVFWVMVRWYPYVSLALISCLLVSTYWETASTGVSNVMVNLIRGKIKTTGGESSGGIIAATAGSSSRLTEVQDSNATPSPNRRKGKQKNKNLAFVINAENAEVKSGQLPV